MTAGTKTATASEATGSKFEESESDPEWIVATDTPIERLDKLDIRWVGTPLARAGLHAYVLAVGALILAVALTRGEVAGVSTGPNLTSVAPMELGLVVTTVEVPLGWLSIIPVVIALVGITIGVRPLIRAFRTEYVITTKALYARQRPFVGDERVSTLSMKRVTDTECRQSFIGRLLSYGTITFSTTEPEHEIIPFRGIADPDVVHQELLRLDAAPDAESPLDRRREYLRVVPATGERSPAAIVRVARSFHKFAVDPTALTAKLNPFDSPSPAFEFLIYSDGTDDPIEFYYTTDACVDTLETRLNGIYPETVEIERVKLDLATKLIPPRVYEYDEFETALDNDTLCCTREEVAALQTVAREQAPDPIATDGSGTRTTESDETASSSPASESVIDLPMIDLDQHREGANGGYTLDSETPVDTGAGVLARPAPSELNPYGVRWNGVGEKTMPLKKFSTDADEDDGSGAGATERRPSRAPLSELIDDFSDARYPIVFQALFEAEPDWSRKKQHIKEGLEGDGRGWRGHANKALRHLNEGWQNALEQSPLQTGQRRRQASDGSTSPRLPRTTNAIDPAAHQGATENELDPQYTAIQHKDAKHSFTVNLRASTVPVVGDQQVSDEPDLKRYLRNLSSAFDPLEGEYYDIAGQKLRDKGLTSRTKRKRARTNLEHLLDHEIATEKRWHKWSSTHPDLLLDTNELCNFTIVPSADHLTTEATKETHARQESRTPLPGLDAAQRRQFTSGMVLGQDANSAVDSPLRLPPNRQTRHWLLCSATGGGKTQVANRMLRSLAATTPGPNVLIEPKGDNMCLHYLMAHYKQFGTLEDVYYFREPETLPAISFFDIRPAIEAGHDRETAIKEKGDHFHALLRMIMEPGQHEQAFVANEILTFLIHALFDPVHGEDVFGLDHLFDAATTMQRDRELPELSPINDDIHDSLASQFEKDDHQFQLTMGAVLNRLNQLIEEPHLHWMLRYTPGRDHGRDDLYGFHDQDAHFEFSELLDEDVTILFDLGDLTLDAQRGFTTVLLSNLWHAIQRRRRSTPENVVNVVIEEAAPFVATELVADQLLPQGRSSGLSLGLIMQYPEQVKSWDDADNGAYEELLTEVHTKIVGDISITDRFAETFTHDDLTVEEVRNRNNRMAAGEWFVKLVTPGFGEDRPAPLTMHSLPIVSGHPESDEPLSEAEQATFDEEILPEVIERTQDEYGLYVPTHEDVMEYGEWGEIEREVGSPPPAPEEVGSEPTSEAASSGEDRGDDKDSSREEGVADEYVREVDDDTRNEPEQEVDEDEDGRDEEASSLSMGSGFFGTEECQIDDTKLRQRGLSRDDGIFLQRVLDAMNRELPGYSLLEGMNQLKDDLDGLDIRVLREQELVEKGKVDRRPYYTVLPAGRELLGQTVTAEPGTGDLGEKTPHKVGVELLFRWLETHDDVERVKRYYKQDSETVFDVAGFDGGEELVWVGEVEMASNNPEAIATDYDKMADVDARAIWAFPQLGEAREIVNSLANVDRLPGEVSVRASRSFSQMKGEIEGFEVGGMTTIQTFRGLKKAVNE